MINQSELKAKMRKLRKFVDFDYDLRKNLHPNSARKIEKYFDELQSLNELSYQKFTGKTKRQTKTAKAISALSLPQFKFAAIPATSKVTLSFDKKGNLKISGLGTNKIFYPFNQRAIARDPEKEIRRVVKLIEEPIIMIYTGDYYYRRADDPEKIIEYCLKLIFRYGAENTKNWLKGLFGAENSPQFDIPEQIRQSELFTKARNAARKKSKYKKLRMK